MTDALLPPDDDPWPAVLARDARRDGDLRYAVRTTGVYCRPSCPSRPKRRENVVFFADSAAARAAGFRPCRRCDPDGPGPAARSAEAVARACRLLEGAEEAPGLAALSAAVGLGEGALRRAFRRETGTTPSGWAAARRAERAGQALRRGASVTEAIQAGGYGAPSRFYEAAPARLGMAPRAWRSGGAGETIRWATGACSLGLVLVAEASRGICAILLGDGRDPLLAELRARFPSATVEPGDGAALARALAVVEGLGGGEALPLDLRGTAFQHRVWAALRETRAGETLSYAELARRAGAPGAARAAGRACAANPVAVAVPCHRAVRSDGAASGYAWGPARKAAMLRREGG